MPSSPARTFARIEDGQADEAAYATGRKQDDRPAGINVRVAAQNHCQKRQYRKCDQASTTTLHESR